MIDRRQVRHRLPERDPDHEEDDQKDNAGNQADEEHHNREDSEDPRQGVAMLGVTKFGTLM